MRNKKFAFRTKTCPICKNDFSGHFPQKRIYCSRSCVYVGNAQKRTKGKVCTCDFCGKEIYRDKTRLESAKNYFCSQNHANEFQKRNKAEYICKTCGKSFSKSKSFEKFGNVKYCSQKCYRSNPDFRNHLINNNVNLQKGKQTKIETIGYQILDELNLNYKPQYLIAEKFCVDALVNNKLVVQFDGDYWHGNSEKYPVLDSRQKRRQNLDKSQDKYLSKCGYKILRIWEHEFANLDSVRNKIIQSLAQRLERGE